MRPYFFSLREIEDNVSLDIRLPLNWKFENIVQQYSSIKIRIQDKNDRFTLLSLVTTATKEGYEIISTCATEIIIKNKEEEEKRRLFDEKVLELKTLFQNESLDKLRDITFIETYGEQEIRSNDQLVGKGNGEGQGGNNESQETVDFGSEEDRQDETISGKRKK